MKQPKTLLICPPVSSPNCVPASIYALKGTLKNHGYETKTLDLNIEFFKYILTQKFLNDCISKIKLSNNPIIIRTFQDNEEKYMDFISKLPQAIRVLKNKKSFYEIKKLRSAYHIIDTLLKLVSLTIFPFVIARNGFFKKDTRLKYSDYKQFTKSDLFDDFFNKYVMEISSNPPELIGFSVSYDTQTLFALILAKKLKERGIQSKIIFGGANITRRIKSIKQDTEFFCNYFDGALIGSGDVSIIDYLEYIEGKRELSDVRNLVYLQDGKVVMNAFSSKLPVKNYYYDYSDYDINNYFLPEGVLHITTSTGCYYNKCAFCFHNEHTPYIQKEVDDVIEEITNIIKEKNINKFLITDNALHPDFADEFSKKILERKIEIYYSTDIRFDEAYNSHLLQQLYNSGLRICYWGLETASNRILKLLDKGTNIETNKRILEIAHKIGILNFVYYMLGLPTETKEDMQLTIDFMSKNNDIIDNSLGMNFLLLKEIKLYKNPEKYGLRKKDVIIKESFEYCPTPLRKVSLEDMALAKDMIDNKYNDINKSFFKYGTNDLMLLYKVKSLI